MNEKKVRKKIDRKEDLTYITNDESLRDELFSSHPRSCVILASSVLEFKLEQLLKKSFINEEIAEELVLKFDAPIGTFSSKIKMCYALGIYSREVYNDLNRIRKIRNIFAHDIYDCNFEQPFIKAIIDEFEYNKTSYCYFDTSDNRTTFIMLILVLDSSLTWLLHFVNREIPTQTGTYEVLLTSFRDAFNRPK